MYAHISNNTIDAVGRPPALAWDGTRWWDLRTLNGDALAATGWRLVTEAPKPADTATQTYDATYVINSGIVQQVWTARAKTPDEITRATEESNRVTVATALDTALGEIQTIIDMTNANINSNPAAVIKVIARALRRVIRMLLNKFEGSA